MLLLICLVCIPALILLYASAVYHTSYWKRRGIDGPKPKPFSGNILDWYGKPINYCLRDWTKTYGKVYGIQEGHTNILVVSDVDMLYQLFVKKFEFFHGRKIAPIIGNVDLEPRVHMFNARGARWKRLRAIANPVFSVSNLKKILPIMDDSMKVTLKFLDKAYEAGKPFNIHPYFHELTMDVISRIAMGQKGSLQFSNPNVKMAQDLFGAIGKSWLAYYSFLFPALAPWIRKVAMATARWRKEPFRAFFDTIAKEVTARKKLRESGDHTSKETVDFIDLFLDAESTEVVNEEQNKAFDKASSKVSKKLTIDEIVAQCLVFLLAGYDTTANALSNTCYFLAKNPDAQARLQVEIDEVCVEEFPTYEHLNQLKYADAVMKEALRLYPIAAFASARTCMETTTLGDYTIEAGTVVQADVLSVHYDKTLWEEPDKFKPERWLENTSNPAVPQWFAFGGGPRLCIGLRLAYLEEKQALVYILRKYNILACDQTEKELKMVGGSVLNPESVTVKLELR